MQTTAELPKAFSVRDEHEILPIQHLLARLNPKLVVTLAGTGRHVSGGCTVFWGVAHLEGQPLTQSDVETALQEAGFDLAHNVVPHALSRWTNGINEK